MNTSYPQGKKAYIVYSVAGDVLIDNKPAAPKQIINTSQKVKFPKESQLTLFDESGKLLYSFGQEGQYTLATLLKESKTSVIQLSANYIRYIKDNLFGSKDTYSNSVLKNVTTGGYRGEEEDAIFLSTVLNRFGTSNCALLYDSLITKRIYPRTDYLISFDLVSYRDGRLAGSSRDVEGPYYVRVTNRSETPLFVNVLNIDTSKQTYLLLQPDSKYGFAKYIVPGNSTVSFLDQHIDFDKNTIESFWLFGFEYPINYSILQGNCQLDNSTHRFSKIGIYSKHLGN